MSRKQETFHSKLLNARTLVAGLIVLLVSVLLLWLSSTLSKDYPLLFGNVIPSVASVFGSSGIFAIVYEVLIRRQQTEFVLEAIDVKESLLRSGLNYISLNYLDFDYGQEIKKSKRIRLFLVYGSTWFGRYALELQYFLSQPDCHLTLCVPDPKSPFFSPLADHFRLTIEEMAKKVAEAVSVCVAPALSGNVGKGASVTVYLHSANVAYSAYQFDQSIFVSTYFASSARRRAPTFQFIEGAASLYNDFNSDLDAVLRNHAKRVYSSAEPVNHLKTSSLKPYMNPNFRNKL